MTIAKQITPLLFVLSCAAAVQPARAAADIEVKSLLTQPLPEFPGKEAVMITVEYPPGGADPVHRHNAHGFIYVLEGTVVMGVQGGKEVTLTPGQTFYEGPADLHTVGRNASTTKPAKFLVMLVKDKGTPILIPEEPAKAVRPAK